MSLVPPVRDVWVAHLAVHVDNFFAQPRIGKHASECDQVCGKSMLQVRQDFGVCTSPDSRVKLGVKFRQKQLSRSDAGEKEQDHTAN